MVSLLVASAAIQTLLVFLLGLNVSLARMGMYGKPRPLEAVEVGKPSNIVARAQRAHGNMVEYSPTLIAIYLYLELRGGAPAWAHYAAIITTIFRIVLSAALLLIPTLVPTKKQFAESGSGWGYPFVFRRVSAIGVYVGGIAAALALVV